MYRFYVQMQDATDRMSAVFGNDQASLLVNTPAGAFNSPFNSSWNASGINPAFLPVFPDLADDSYATIGLSGPASTSGIAGAADPSIVEDATQAITPYFLTPGATNLESTTLTGASWYVLNTATNGLPDANGRVLVMQVTTTGSISGQMNYQVFPLGVGADQVQVSVEFDGAGTFGGGGGGNACGCTNPSAVNYDASAEYDDGSCILEVLGCTDESACNYNVDANTDDGSCAELDCDGVCGGSAEIDDCGICNGPGAIYDCGCSDIPAGDCDCDGNQLDALGECGGPCEADADADGICDDVDDCVGELDACGICNGPGAIYDCGCSDIPAGDCDCDGNQLDALGECGGPCEADADADGICDDVDDCIGSLDACGICNGPGAIYDCGCSDIPAGDCDCDGNQLDALGECGGPCEADANGNGVCDDAEIAGCTDEAACNYDSSATEDDGSCDYCSCGGGGGAGVAYPLVVEASPAVGAGGTVYRFYVQMQDATDRMSAVFGNDQASLLVNTPAGAFNSPFNSSWNASGINPAFLPVFPDLADDSYATIGLSGPASTSGIAGAADPSIVEDATQAITPYFLTPGATNLESTTLTGASWYVLNTATNGLPDANGRVLVMQVTTTGSISGQMNYQVFPLGVGADQVQVSVEFDGAGTFGGGGGGNACGCTNPSAVNYDASAEYDDGSCILEVLGCTDESACNYNVDANTDDGSCAELDCDGVCGGSAEIDDCGICNGPGAIYDCGCSDIPAGDCDCDGNQLDALGECGGPCEADADADGICDDVDDCVGELDACGICNGPGAIYDCGCSDIPAGDCDCDGNQLDALGECGGPCEADADADGICDDVDDCIGSLDACGICNGPGAIYDCGCSDIPAGDCDCDGNQLDALGECGGPCEADADADGICDDVDDCVGELDACGICNGPGAIYDCGCSDIPAGDCDCDGNQLDALGECGGPCEADADADGICDDVDDCIGALDACGICNGPGAIYDCGCSDIPAGDCDCDGNQLDALGECGGPCEADADADGICDDVDDCVGELDACGICNGPGAIYDCGCSDIPAGDCDCDGNQLDALGECGGPCAADANGNGICDDQEIGGCTDPMNPGFDPNATVDDGSCLVGGCLIVEACNYDASADYQLPGACEFESCAGCTDYAACNYDSQATIDDDSCDFPEEYLDCDGECLNDADGDGTCDELEILGCTEEGNPGYDPAATEDDGSCLVAGCLLPFACNFDPTADYIVVSLCDFTSCVGCTDEGACNYDATASLGSVSACDYPSIPFLDCDGSCLNDTDGDGVCDEQEIPGCTDTAAVNFNQFATDDDGSCIILQGGCVLPFACNFDPAADFYLPGSCDFSCLFGAGDADCNNPDACNFGATDEPCVFFDADGNTCVPGGCTTEGACNYDVQATYNDGSCDFASCQVFGCNVDNACNYNASATANDGSCDFVSCLISAVDGCTNPLACNFDAEANVNDGSCDFTTCAGLGCTDEFACNYDNTALVNDGSCQLATDGVDCDGNCIMDSDMDGVCDMNEVGGCNDMGANNFDANATDNDGTCSYDAEGCMDMYACNFNHQATADNGSCDFDCYGCMNANACNYDMAATLHDAESCSFIFNHTLEGDSDVTLEEATSYSYAFNAGSEYIWEVEGGVIVDGQGSHQVSVMWLLEEGVISVREVNAEGCEGEVSSLIVTGNATNIVEGTFGFTAFPNPVHGTLYVNAIGHGVHDLQILDAAGRVVLGERLVEGQNTINVSGLASGTYQLVVNHNDSRSMEQLVVTH